MIINNVYRQLDPVSTAQMIAMAKSERSLRNGRVERDELRALTGADRALLAAIYGEDEYSRVPPLAALWLDQQRRLALFDRELDPRIMTDLHKKARRRSDPHEREELENFTRSAMVYFDSLGMELDEEARAVRDEGGFSLYV